jgi:hypothetical protein
MTTIAVLTEPLPLPGALLFPVVRVLAVPALARVTQDPAGGQDGACRAPAFRVENSAASEPARARAPLPRKGATE